MSASSTASQGAAKPSSRRTPAGSGAPAVFADGGAGLVSTVDDYFAFSRLLLDHGRIRGRPFVSEAIIDAMTTDHVTRTQRRGGWPILANGAGGLGTTWYADPGTGRSATPPSPVMFDSRAPPTVHRELRRAAFRSAAN